MIKFPILLFRSIHSENNISNKRKHFISLFYCLQPEDKMISHNLSYSILACIAAQIQISQGRI